MKNSEILKMDSRGRIVIPRSMRQALGLKHNSQIMAISDSDSKEIKLIPLPFYSDEPFIKIRILLKDVSGALAQIATIFGDMGISLLYGQTVVIKKGQQAEWTVISPVPEIPIEDFVEKLKTEGDALAVEILEPKHFEQSNE